MLIVTGTGRCGTGYMARLLAIGHEQTYTPDGTRQPIGPDSSVFAAASLPVDAHVVHVVRDPWPTVASLAAGHVFREPPTKNRKRYRYRRFCERHEPAVFDREGHVRRAAAWYVRWNLRIEPHADERVRVEDVDPGDVRRWCDILDVDPAPALHRLNALPSDVNTRKVELPDVDSLPREVREMGARYGYSSCG